MKPSLLLTAAAAVAVTTLSSDSTSTIFARGHKCELFTTVAVPKSSKASLQYMRFNERQNAFISPFGSLPSCHALCRSTIKFKSGTPCISRWPSPTLPSHAFFSSSSHYSTTTTTTSSLASHPPSNSFEQTPLEKQMTSDIQSIIRASIKAVDPKSAIQTHLSFSSTCDSLVITDPSSSNTKRKSYYSKKDYDNVVIIAFGKASVDMTLECAKIVKEGGGGNGWNMSGYVIMKDDHATQDQIDTLENDYNIQVYPASHPIPDERSVSAASKILSTVSNISNDRTLILCCVSGGGSALFCTPRPPLTLSDLAATNKCLLSSGMSIDKMNVIRKRLEEGKGGKLAAAAYPSSIVTLVLSDIIGDPLDLIASGPTLPDDDSCWEDALNLVMEHGLHDGGPYELPKSVLDVLKRGVDGELDDTPRSDHPVFCTPRQDVVGSDEEKSMLSETILVGNNDLAVSAAAAEADRLGYNPIILGTTIEGEAKDVAGVYTAMVERLNSQKMKGETDEMTQYGIAKLPAALIGGGETTVTLSSDNCGKGGRNQEIGLVAALNLRAKKIRDVVLASVGTDGTDGPTDAAGAIVDGGTIDRLEFRNGGTMTGEDSLRRHDAYTFFDSVASCSEKGEKIDLSYLPLVKTGPTGTNVADVCIVLVR